MILLNALSDVIHQLMASVITIPLENPLSYLYTILNLVLQFIAYFQ